MKALRNGHKDFLMVTNLQKKELKLIDKRNKFYLRFKVQT